jgi:uncharacterized alpha/beta hydrolase family protein
MKKLVLSLVIVMFTAIIFLGWSLDTLFNNYQEQQHSDEFSAYRKIVASLATTLDSVPTLLLRLGNGPIHNN